MRCLVTGGSGFIGTNLIQRLLKDGHEVSATFNKNIRVNPDVNWLWWDLNEATPANKLPVCDVVFHLAASSHPNADNPYSIFTNNLNSTTNLVAAYPESRLVFASSIVVYGDQYNATEQTKLSPTTIYGASKAACEQLLLAHNVCGRGNTISLRLSATVGQNMTHGFLPALLKKLNSNEDEITLLGGWPGTTKPYTHVDDVVNALIHASQIEFKGSVNYCANDAVSIDSIAEVVMKKLNKTKKIKWAGWESLWPGDNIILKSNNDLSKKFGFLQPPSSWTAIERSL